VDDTAACLDFEQARPPTRLHHQAGHCRGTSGRPPNPEWLDGAACAEIYGEGGEFIARHALFGRAEPG